MTMPQKGYLIPSKNMLSHPGKEGIDYITRFGVRTTPWQMRLKKQGLKDPTGKRVSLERAKLMNTRLEANRLNQRPQVGLKPPGLAPPAYPKPGDVWALQKRLTRLRQANNPLTGRR